MQTACMRWRRRAWWSACLMLWCTFAQRTSAQSDHLLVWRSLQTAHFRIHYHEPLGVLARVFADQAEAIHARVSGALRPPASGQSG